MLLPELPRGTSWSEQFRHECEMRVIVAMQPERRKLFLAGVIAKRGEAAAQRIVRSLPTLALRQLAEER